MEFINHTPHPASLFRTGLEDDRFAAAAILRVTYDLQTGSPLNDPAVQFPLSKAPWISEYGPMEGDDVFYRGGVDLFVLGSAKAPGRRPVKTMEVTVRFSNGRIAHRLRVTGHRLWQETSRGISFSEPEPFTEMPLDLAHAYGGADNWDGLKIPFANNPYGKGYLLNKTNLDGKPLPNLEAPDQLISGWEQQPDPVGTACCPLNELRMRGNVEFDGEGNLSKFKSGFFNTAFPGMIAPKANAGDTLAAEGVNWDGPVAFTLPQHNLHIRLRIGDKVLHNPLYVDQVALLPDKGQAFVTYRFPFRYYLRPLEIRQCEIFENA